MRPPTRPTTWLSFWLTACRRAPWRITGPLCSTRSALPWPAGHSRPLVAAHEARVALGDAIAGALNARAVLILIGERPGLSTPESLGAYLTWAPTPTTTDADRNCISNIHPAGLNYVQAAGVIAYLLEAARAMGQSGVALKDESGGIPKLPLAATVQ